MEENVKDFVQFGSLLSIDEDCTFSNDNGDEYTVKSGDSVIVGFDGYIHCIKNNVLIEIGDEYEVQGVSADGLATFLVGCLESTLDLSNELRHTMIDTDEVYTSILKGLEYIGAKLTEKDENFGAKTENN